MEGDKPIEMTTSIIVKLSNAFPILSQIIVNQWQATRTSKMFFFYMKYL